MMVNNLYCLFALLPAILVGALPVAEPTEDVPVVARSHPVLPVVQSRQMTREKLVERQVVATIFSKMKTRTGSALHARDSPTPFPSADPSIVSTRAYARFPGWNNAQNDIPTSETNPSPRTSGVASESDCLLICNAWVDPDEEGRSCTGVYWQPDYDGSCWLKGTNIAGYEYTPGDSDAFSDQLGSCDTWQADDRMPVEMQAVCQDIHGTFTG